MFFGLTVSLDTLVVLGLLTYTVLAAQMLVGLRIIKLGKRHRVWHRRLAFTILALATIARSGGHGVLLRLAHHLTDRGGGVDSAPVERRSG